MKQQTEWIHCPMCGNKTRDRIREDTVLKNYPLYCPKCKQETLINVYILPDRNEDNLLKKFSFLYGDTILSKERSNIYITEL